MGAVLSDMVGKGHGLKGAGDQEILACQPLLSQRNGTHYARMLSDLDVSLDVCKGDPAVQMQVQP